VGGDKDGELLHMATSDPLRLNKQIPINPKKKRKNDVRYEEEIEVSDNWSRFIVLKSSEGDVPLTTISPFVIENASRAVQEK
jgi:hypothetical protein